MFEDCIPDLVVKHFDDINFADLYRRGIRFLIIDVDNTLVCRKSELIVPAMIDSVRRAKECGIRQICLLSNIGFKSDKGEARIGRIAQKVGADVYVCACWPNIKPKPAPFRKALSIMPGAETSNTAVIGDQLLSDIKGGKRLGMYTIWVQPLGPDHWITFWKRLVEIPIKNKIASLVERGGI